MKRLVTSLCAAFVFLFAFAMIPFEGECRSISDDVFRVHILANSDSEVDQKLKLSVRDDLLKESESLFSDVHSKDEAMKKTEENLDYFAKCAYDVLSANGYDYPVTAQISRVCFNTRHYDNITMPGGYYDALQIKIGNAQGRNWWCVMYPSLCFGSATRSDALKEQLTDSQYNIVSSESKYVFKFKVVEIFNSILHFFSR